MEDSTKIILAAIAGVALVITVLISAAVYDNSQNIQRDEYVTGHCKVVSGSAANLYNNSVRYDCGESK